MLTELSELPARADVVVIGSGASGVTAALRASQDGASVVILEKAELLGGTTAAGGGVIWAPCNPLMQQRGWSDSPAEATAYLQAAAGQRMSQEEIAWYVRTAPEAIEWLTSSTRVRLVPLGRPDYHREWPGSTEGGRGLDNEAFDPAPFPGLAEALRPPTYFPLLSMDERDHLNGRAPDAELLAARAETGVRTMGGALAGTLLASALERGISIAASARVTGLELLERTDDVDPEWQLGISDGAGRIAASTVVIASGGFEWNEHLRTTLLDHPITPISAPSNEGDGLYLGMAAGADIDETGSVWGVPVITAQGESYDGIPSGRMGNVEMTLPGSLTVNARGRRFVNEALNYHDLARVFSNVDPVTSRQANNPAWLVFDRTYLERYPVAGSTPGQPEPWMASAATLSELAEEIGVDPAGLGYQVSRFNDDARRGVDTEFGRGSTEQDRHLGDDSVTPNPCLAPLETGPFYAVPIHAGVLGTAGGLRADLDGRVLDRQGDPVPGLYAAGNCSATVFRNAYPGGGATLGSAVVRGFAAGRHIAAHAPLSAR